MGWFLGEESLCLGKKLGSLFSSSVSLSGVQQKAFRAVRLPGLSSKCLGLRYVFSDLSAKAVGQRACKLRTFCFAQAFSLGS